jgi:hypothetical protein
MKKRAYEPQRVDKKALLGFPYKKEINYAKQVQLDRGLNLEPELTSSCGRRGGEIY